MHTSDMGRWNRSTGGYQLKKKSGGAPRKLLKRQSGYAVPDRITAIMGPSGSGKSTLLDAFAEACILVVGTLISNPFIAMAAATAGAAS
ncbi:hypothetical protein H0E87_013399 [Populus deltoides]|uniref:ABC transporter domain-containing protein n=1 Tax=Populus deltoides TaxID=3696 RepID=A0A8T2YN47_POPDE|nr:hypothetical protein H0E87_013399 [Populus deltoides]